MALIPQHAEKISPPRTLAVPYPLGRPLGAPGNAEFQHRVLTAALSLLQRSGKTVFETHEEDAPELGDTEEAWVCPVSFAQTGDKSLMAQVLDEMTLLQPWYDKGRETRSTSVGVSGLDLQDAVRFVASFLEAGEPTINTVEDRPIGDQLKYAVEDIKAFYNEAAASQPGAASVQEMEDWYWGDTSAGSLVRLVKQATLAHENKSVKLAASFLLVPRSQEFRDST